VTLLGIYNCSFDLLQWEQLLAGASRVRLCLRRDLHLLYRLPHAAVQTYDFEHAAFENSQRIDWLGGSEMERPWGLMCSPRQLPAILVLLPRASLATRRIGWQEEMDSRFGRKFVRSIFSGDGTGRVLVDPQGASMDVHRNFSDEVSASALLSPNLVPERLRNFLATRGLVPSEKIKLDERIIPQGFPLFVFGTLGENKTMNASIPRPQICGASPLSYSFHPGGGTLMFRMSSKRALNADKVLAFANALGRVPAVHVETRVTRMGTPVDAFSQGTKRASAPPCLLPQQFFRSSRQLRRRLPALHQTQQSP